jgi:hypothetical protein
VSRWLVEDRGVLDSLLGRLGGASWSRRLRLRFRSLAGRVALGLALSGFGCAEELCQRAVTHACAFSRH